MSRSLSLAKKSIDCMISAIEIYNKPDFKYREELFSILSINSWELLLKAKILRDNRNDLRSIYVKDFLKTKAGLKSKKCTYKESRTGNKLSIEILTAAKRLSALGILNEKTIENIELMVDIRDNSIHFINKDELLSLKVQEVGMGTIQSYLKYVADWFSISLEKYNFYLMPMSFFHGNESTLVSLESHDAAVAGLLKLIAQKENQYPFDPNSNHNITVSIKATVSKPNAVDIQKLSISNDPNAPSVTISLEDVRKTHPLTYKMLVEKLRNRYSDFLTNEKFSEIKGVLQDDKRFYFPYPQNPMNPSGSSKPLYSLAVFDEFDKYYTRKLAK